MSTTPAGPANSTAGTPAPSAYRPSTLETTTMSTPTTLTRWAPGPHRPTAPRRSTRPGTAFVPVDRDPAPEPITGRPAGSWDVLPRAAAAASFGGCTWTFLLNAPDGYPVVTFAYTATWAALSALTAGAYLNHRTSTSKTIRPVVAPLLRLLAGGALRAPLTAPAPAPAPARELPARPVVHDVDVPVVGLNQDGRPVVVGVLVRDLPAELPNTYVPGTSTTAEEATR